MRVHAKRDEIGINLDIVDTVETKQLLYVITQTPYLKMEIK